MSKKLFYIFFVSFFLLLIAQFVLTKKENYKQIDSSIDIAVLEPKEFSSLPNKRKLLLINAYYDKGDEESFEKAMELGNSFNDVSQIDLAGRLLLANELGKIAASTTGSLEEEKSIYARFLFEDQARFVKNLYIAIAYLRHGEREKAIEFLEKAKPFALNEKGEKIVDDFLADLEGPSKETMSYANVIVGFVDRYHFKHNVPIKRTLDLLFSVWLVFLSYTLMKSPRIKAGWKMFWKVLFFASLAVMIFRITFVSMHWFVYLVETFIEPFRA